MLNNTKIIKNNPEQNVLNFLEMSELNVIELDYLIKLAHKLGEDILIDSRENIFQDNPKFNSNGRVETFGAFYKRNIISSIIWGLLINYAEFIYELSRGDKKSFLENYSLFHFDRFLQNEYDNIFLDFILKNDLSENSKEEIILKFGKYCKKELEKY